MRTEDYLEQIKRIEFMINDKLDEISRLKSIATSISVATDKENVKKSSSQDKLADAVAKIVDLEAETDALVDNLIDKRRRIINQIDAIGNFNFYKVLTLRYVSNMKIDAIADKMGFSVPHIKEIKRNALKEFEKYYGNEYLSL